MSLFAWLYRRRVRKHVRTSLEAALGRAGYEVAAWDRDVATVAGQADLGNRGQFDMVPLVEGVTRARDPRPVDSIIERAVAGWVADRALREELRADVDAAMKCVLPMPAHGPPALEDTALCALPWAPELIIGPLGGGIPGVPPVLMRTFVLDHGDKALRVTRGELDAWGMTVEQVDEVALANLRERSRGDRVEVLCDEPEVRTITSADGLAASRAFLLEELVPASEDRLGLFAVMPKEHVLLAWPVRRARVHFMAMDLFTNAVRLLQEPGDSISHEVIWIRGGKADRINIVMVPDSDERGSGGGYLVRVVSVEGSATSEIFPVNVTFD